MRRHKNGMAHLYDAEALDGRVIGQSGRHIVIMGMHVVAMTASSPHASDGDARPFSP